MCSWGGDVMSNFTELPVANGVGPYHINRFRIFFPAPAGQKPGQLGREFVDGFERFFNPNSAEAHFGPSSYGGDKTIEFAFDLPGPNFHHDWVYICGRRNDDDCAGFAAQTLKRNFEDGGDKVLRAEVAAAVGAALGLFPILFPLALILAQRLGDLLVWVNQHHFLAGRRSWMIVDSVKMLGDGLRDKSASAAPERRNRYVYQPVYVLETAAIERSSMSTYAVLQKIPEIVDAVLAIGPPSLINLALLAIPDLREWLVKQAQGVAKKILDQMGLDIRGSIVDIWCTLLTNYVKAKGFDTVAAPPGLSLPSNRGPVTYQQLEMDSASGEVVSQIRLIHPAL